MTSRVIALVDMDCFYVQVEERLNPNYKGKPAAVVQYNTWKGGGIIAVNYEARGRGVTRFMRGDEAKEKCPEIILVSVKEQRGKADLTKYRDAGNEVLEVMCKFCKCIQRASVDEAYLDLTEEVDKRFAEEKYPGDLLTSLSIPNTFVVGYAEDGNNDEDKRSEGTAEWLKTLWDPDTDTQSIRLAVGAAIVEEMRAAIFTETTFRCSAGISGNKVLSKLACGLHKPNRQTILPHSSVPELFSRLPVRKVRSLGGKLGASLVEELGCKVMADLTKFSESELHQRFDDKTGSFLYNIARGIEDDPVVPRLVAKSIGCCKNFSGRNALHKRADVAYWMQELASEVGERLEKDMAENRRRARLLTVHIQQSAPNGGPMVSVSRSGPLTSYEPSKIASDAIRLIAKTNVASANSDAWIPPLKFLGLSTGKFVNEDLGQMTSIQRFFTDSKSPSSMPSTSKQLPKQEDKSLSVAEVEDDCAPSTSFQVEEDTDIKTNPDSDVEETKGNQSPPRARDDDILLGSPQQCHRCSAQIPVALFPEHLDHHIAMDLHAELNSNQSETVRANNESHAVPVESVKTSPAKNVTKVVERKKRGRGRGMSSRVEKVTKVRKIVDFFAPKA